MNKLILTVGLFLLIPFSMISSETKAELPDSIIDIDYTYTYCMTDPEKAQQILDELRKRKQEPEWALDWCQGDLYYNTGKYRLASYFFEKTAQYVEVKDNPELYMGLISTMMECYLISNNIELAMKFAVELVSVAEKLDNPAEIGRAYLFMGKVMYQQKNHERAKEYFELSEKYSKKAGNPEYLYYVDLTLAGLYSSNKEYDQAYEKALAASVLLEEMENSDELTFPDNSISYEKGRLYALTAEILADMGKLPEAETYYALFNQTLSATDSQYTVYIVPYLLETKKYAKAIQITEERYQIMKSETSVLEQDMLTVLNYLIEGYQLSGQLGKALAYSKEAIEIGTHMLEKESGGIAAEFSVIHEVQMKDAELQKKENELAIKNNLLIASSIVILLFIVIAVLVLYTTKRIKNKDRSIVRQIRQHEKYKKEQEQKEEQLVVDAPHQLKASLDSSEIEQARIKKIFQTIDQTIRRDRLFLDPNLTRDDLTELLLIKRNDVIQAINEFSGNTFTDYINEFRIKESLVLLETSDNHSIDQIAELAGFGSTRSFYRQFKKKYNMSPSQYRKLALND